MASNAPQTISVTLNVNPTAPPVIAHNVSSALTSSCIQGSNPSSRSFDVWNSGGGTLSYTSRNESTLALLQPFGGNSHHHMQWQRS